MTINIEPELGVPLPKDIKQIDLKERVSAMFNTVEMLEKHGLDTPETREDSDTAAYLAASYAEDPEKASKALDHKKAAELTPASITMTKSILDEFSHSVVESAVQIRHLVTNKLILLSENPDPRVQLNALTALGKISDVGLFTEKSEVTVHHQTTDIIKEQLRKKLQRLTAPHADIEDAVIIEGETIDVDAELGIDD